MSKYAVAVFDGFQGALTNQVVEAESQVGAIMQLDRFKGNFEDSDLDGKSYEQVIVEYFSEDIQVVVVELAQPMLIGVITDYGAVEYQDYHHSMIGMRVYAKD